MIVHFRWDHSLLPQIWAPGCGLASQGREQVVFSSQGIRLPSIPGDKQRKHFHYPIILFLVRTRVQCRPWSSSASRTRTSSTSAWAPPPSRTSRCRSGPGSSVTPTLFWTPHCPLIRGRRSLLEECPDLWKLVIIRIINELRTELELVVMGPSV